MKYIKKSCEVEAIQFKGTDTSHIDMLNNWGSLFIKLSKHSSLTNDIRISTPHGLMYATKGDWIVKEVNEFYVVKDAVFQTRYEIHRA
jgi:galactitol-specific phosphotransferase system IIC component